LPSFCFHTASNASGKKVESDISVVLFENEEAAVDYAKEKVEKKGSCFIMGGNNF